jgi:hypothetical protein
MPASIIPFLQDRSFDPEHIKIMGAAYDRASRALRDRGQPDIVMEILAKRVIAVAETGLRDPEQISKRVLEAFGIIERAG